MQARASSSLGSARTRNPRLRSLVVRSGGEGQSSSSSSRAAEADQPPPSSSTAAEGAPPPPRPSPFFLAAILRSLLTSGCICPSAILSVYSSAAHTRTGNRPRCVFAVLCRPPPPPLISARLARSNPDMAFPLSRRGCFVCGKPGHVAAACSSTERLCFNCGVSFRTAEG